MATTLRPSERPRGYFVRFSEPQESRILREAAAALHTPVSGLIRAIVVEKLKQVREEGYLKLDLGSVEVKL